MNETLIKDLMGKLDDDTKSALDRVLELYAMTVPRGEREQFTSGAVNIIRAGIRPFLRELLAISPPEKVLVLVAMQIIYMARILNGKRDILSDKVTGDIMRSLTRLVTAPLKRGIDDESGQ